MRRTKARLGIPAATITFLILLLESKLQSSLKLGLILDVIDEDGGAFFQVAYVYDADSSTSDLYSKGTSFKWNLDLNVQAAVYSGLLASPAPRVPVCPYSKHF